MRHVIDKEAGDKRDGDSLKKKDNGKGKKSRAGFGKRRKMEKSLDRLQYGRRVTVDVGRGLSSGLPAESFA